VLRTDIAACRSNDRLQGSCATVPPGTGATLRLALYELYGGTNARSGRRTCWSQLIVATVGHTAIRQHPPRLRSAPEQPDAVSARCVPVHVLRRALRMRELSRDHIRPFSQGGTDVWMNVVTACRRCNNHKASRTPTGEDAAHRRAFTPTTRNTFSSKVAACLRPDGVLVAHFPPRPAARPHPALAVLKCVGSELRVGALIFLVDASVYVFRAYHSMLPEMRDRDGNPVHAVFGFARFLGISSSAASDLHCGGLRPAARELLPQPHLPRLQGQPRSAPRTWCSSSGAAANCAGTWLSMFVDPETRPMTSSARWLH